VTTTGEVNSIVKTRANGSVQANSLILGGSSTYEILALDTTTVVFKTPAQGEILRAVGGSGGVSPTFPTVEIPGSVNIAGTGVSESVLQNQSTLNGESRLAVDWIYSSFIEAAGEKGSASTGLTSGCCFLYSSCALFPSCSYLFMCFRDTFTFDFRSIDLSLL